MRLLYTDEEWRTFISEQKESGLSIVKYCSDHDLSKTTFYKKKKKIVSGELEHMPILFEKVALPEQMLSLVIDGHTIQCTADVLRELVGCLK